jgi:hypothetical protein
VRAYARAAGVLGLLSLVAGGFGEAYVPGVLVYRDVAAAGQSIVASESLFRFGFAAYLVEAVCDVGLTFLFYSILWPVRKSAALLSVFFRLIGTAGFAMAQAFYFAALSVVGGAGIVPADQSSELLAYTLTVSSYSQSLFMMFYGIGSVLLGYLIYRSGFLPKVIGIVLAVGGLGFIANTFAWALAPSLATPLLLVPAGVAALILTLWLLIAGVDVAKWHEKATCSEAE